MTWTVTEHDTHLDPEDVAHLTPEQARLAHMMSAISEDYYYAGWLHGLEHDLWSMVEGGARDFGTGTVAEEEVARLREYSAACGGWIVWCDGPQFVTLAEWAAEAKP